MDASPQTAASEFRDPTRVLGRWLGELSAGQEELSGLLEAMFAELTTALEDWAKVQAAHVAHLQQREKELAERAASLEQSLAEQRRLQDELAQLREQLNARAAEMDRQAQAIQAQVEELQRRATEAQHSEAEWQSLREIVLQLRSLTATRPPSEAAGGAERSHPDVSQWEERIRQLEEDLNEAQRQRELLETEVVVLRHRAMEWLEMLADQRRQLLEERNRWSGELRQFRRLVEVLLDHHVEITPEHQEDQEPNGPPRVIPYEPAEARRTGTGDAFLDSLSAQFEQLRRDFDRRRGK